MGVSIKTDIDRVNSKGKSIYEIPKKYKVDDPTVFAQNQGKNNKYQKEEEDDDEGIDSGLYYGDDHSEEID